MDSKLYMIVSEELAATATKMFDARQQARKYWIQSHRKIKRKAGQVGLNIQDDDATSHRTNAVKMLLQKLCKNSPDFLLSLVAEKRSFNFELVIR